MHATWGYDLRKFKSRKHLNSASNEFSIEMEYIVMADYNYSCGTIADVNVLKVKKARRSKSNRGMVSPFRAHLITSANCRDTPLLRGSFVKKDYLIENVLFFFKRKDFQMETQ